MEFGVCTLYYLQHQIIFHGSQVGVIGNLVHSSPNIKKEVLLAGALQPVIGLLRYAPTLDSLCFSIFFFFLFSYYLSTTTCIVEKKKKKKKNLPLLKFLCCVTVPSALRVKERQLYYLGNLLQLILIARWIIYLCLLNFSCLELVPLFFCCREDGGN